MLKRAIKSACLMSDISFQRLLEAVEQSSEYLFDEEQAMICNPPVSCSSDRRVLKFGARSTKSACYKCLCRVAFGCDGSDSAWVPSLLCAAFQNVIYPVCGCSEGWFEDGDLVEGWNACSQRTSIFELEAKAFYYVQAPGVYHNDPLVKRLKNISVAPYSIHFA